MTLDGDWVCEEDNMDDDLCYAVWQFCDQADCDNGMVPLGAGRDVDADNVNLPEETREFFRGKRDVCVVCGGSGGGYICALHDLDDDE